MAASTSVSVAVDAIEKHKADATKQRTLREQADKRAADAVEQAKQAGQDAEQARKQLAENVAHNAAAQIEHERVAAKAAAAAGFEVALAAATAEVKKLEALVEKHSARADKAEAAATEAETNYKNTKALAVAGIKAQEKYDELASAVADRTVAEQRIAKIRSN